MRGLALIYPVRCLRLASFAPAEFSPMSLPTSPPASHSTSHPASSPTALKVWIDGKLVEKADARVSVYDHGVLYGDGVFEGIRVYSGRIFECDAHLQRLYDSARAIRLNVPYSAGELKAAMEQTFRANNFQDCYIRLVVTRGPGPLGIDPAKCPVPCVYIITDLIHVYAKEMYEKGIPVITSSIIRNHPSALS